MACAPNVRTALACRQICQGKPRCFLIRNLPTGQDDYAVMIPAPDQPPASFASTVASTVKLPVPDGFAASLAEI